MKIFIKETLNLNHCLKQINGNEIKVSELPLIFKKYAEAFRTNEFEIQNVLEVTIVLQQKTDKLDALKFYNAEMKNIPTNQYQDNHDRIKNTIIEDQNRKQRNLWSDLQRNHFKDELIT